jgi:hypothetical protein
MAEAMAIAGAAASPSGGRLIFKEAQDQSCASFSFLTNV